MLSNSMDKLGVSQPIRTSSKLTEMKDIQLNNNMKVCFISNSTNQGSNAILLSQSEKSTGKFSEVWDSQFLKWSVTLVDFKRDVTISKRSQI